MEIKKFGKRYKRSQITALKHLLVKTVRKHTPRDTGNLRQNATYCYNTSYGFNVVIDSTYAYYVKYVDKPSQERMAKSIKVSRNANYVDRAVTDCVAIIKQFGRDYKKPLEKKSTRLTPLFTTSAFQTKVLNDEMEGNVIDGFGTYYHMNKRLTKSVLKAYDEENIDLDYDYDENDYSDMEGSD